MEFLHKEKQHLVWDVVLERKTGLEPATAALARQCSTTEPLPRIFMVPWGGIEPPTRGFSVPCSTDWATKAKINNNQRFVATQNGIEPSTSSVTGWRSNHLNYWAILKNLWWAFTGLNRGPTGYEPVALTNWAKGPNEMVGVKRLELPAPWSQTTCATNCATPRHLCWLLYDTTKLNQCQPFFIIFLKFFKNFKIIYLYHFIITTLLYLLINYLSCLCLNMLFIYIFGLHLFAK